MSPPSSGPCDRIFIRSSASYAPGEYPVLTPQTHSLSTGAPLPDGYVYRINTGSPLPLGADAVVMVEDTELVSSTTTADGIVEEGTVKILVSTLAGENVRASGSDVRQGELVLESGTVLGTVGGEVGTLAFIGRREVRFELPISYLQDDRCVLIDPHSYYTLQVQVYRKPVIAIMSTGNEITDLHADSATQIPNPGKFRQTTY